MKAALPAAGVAKLRDVTKNTFGQFVDEDNRLGRQQIYLSKLCRVFSFSIVDILMSNVMSQLPSRELGRL